MYIFYMKRGSMYTRMRCPAVLALSGVLALAAFLFRAPSASAIMEEEVRVLELFYPDTNLVVAATRSPKPLSRAAENITVVTAREIEELNPHSLGQLLSYITGVMVDFQGEIYTGPVIVRIQDSWEQHVLVLLDGIPWNSAYGSVADITTIPVGIIERIEIVKGPGSSAWGSSLGGVINIITKAAGEGERAKGSVSAFGAGHASWDGRAQVAGKAGPVGYYLYAGRTETDGLRDGRYFEASSFYGKMNLPLGQETLLTFTTGTSDPNYKYGDYPSADITSRGSSRATFATASLEAPLTADLGLTATFHRMWQDNVQINDVLGEGLYGPPGDLFLRSSLSQASLGGSARLAWSGEMQTAVLGFDAGGYETTITSTMGPVLQSYGLPEMSRASPGLTVWAVYANDTIVLGDWSVTPGLRYDHLSKGGEFTSPSLGLTWSPIKQTILRAGVSRGFTAPGLISTSVGSLFLDPNPDLQPEEVWSYQVGAETRTVPFLWLKVTLFRHDQDQTHTVSIGGGSTPGNDIMVNDGRVHRTGVEAEVETVALHGFSVKAGLDYIHEKDDSDGESFDVSGYNILVRYDEGRALRALLAGRYLWWGPVGDSGARYNNFTWDLSLRHKLFNAGGITAEAGLAVHNLFNTSNYTVADVRNARRWVEAGLRLAF